MIAVSLENAILLGVTTFMDQVSRMIDVLSVEEMETQGTAKRLVAHTI
jgi:hypothetical protein